MGLLDCVNNARIQVGVGRLDDLDVLGLAVAVDSERETDRGIHGNEGLGKAFGKLERERSNQAGCDDSGADTEVRGGSSSVVRGSACIGHYREEHRREHDGTCNDMTHDLPP